MYHWSWMLSHDYTLPVKLAPELKSDFKRIFLFVVLAAEYLNVLKAISNFKMQWKDDIIKSKFD